MAAKAGKPSKAKLWKELVSRIQSSHHGQTWCGQQSRRWWCILVIILHIWYCTMVLFYSVHNNCLHAEWPCLLWYLCCSHILYSTASISHHSPHLHGIALWSVHNNGDKVVNSRSPTLLHKLMGTKCFIMWLGVLYRRVDCMYSSRTYIPLIISPASFSLVGKYPPHQFHGVWLFAL